MVCTGSQIAIVIVSVCTVLYPAIISSVPKSFCAFCTIPTCCAKPIAAHDAPQPLFIPLYHINKRAQFTFIPPHPTSTPFILSFSQCHQPLSKSVATPIIMRTPFRPTTPPSTTSSLLPPPNSQPLSLPQSQQPSQPPRNPSQSTSHHRHRHRDRDNNSRSNHPTDLSSRSSHASSHQTNQTSSFHPSSPPPFPSSSYIPSHSAMHESTHSSTSHSHRQPAFPKSFVPPHSLASMSRQPEPMARSYVKRRPPAWL